MGFVFFFVRESRILIVLRFGVSPIKFKKKNGGHFGPLGLVGGGGYFLIHVLGVISYIMYIIDTVHTLCESLCNKFHSYYR